MSGDDEAQEEKAVREISDIRLPSRGRPHTRQSQREPETTSRAGPLFFYGSPPTASCKSRVWEFQHDAPTRHIDQGWEWRYSEISASRHVDSFKMRVWVGGQRSLTSRLTQENLRADEIITTKLL